MIYFSKPSITDIERGHIAAALAGKLCGDGSYTHRATELLRQILGIPYITLTTSGSTSLDMAAYLCDLREGDEVIMPSFTFSSTANAVLMRGARPVFCEIDPRTMNIDVSRIEELITPRTRAIWPVHYAGVVCDMDGINAIAKKHGLKVVEDAAQAVGSTYRGEPAGSLSDYGCFSFHDTKNYTMGEGGALVLRDADELRRTEIFREKGTDRTRFIRGEVDKYTWQSPGGSFLPSDLLAAMLVGQLERFDEIMDKRMAVYNAYREGFAEAEKKGDVIRPFVPPECGHNAHMFFLILPDEARRNQLMAELKKRDITAVFHYIPLHNAPMGQEIGGYTGQLPLTEAYAARLVRLPLYADMTEGDTAAVIENVLALI